MDRIVEILPAQSDCPIEPDIQRIRIAGEAGHGARIARWAFIRGIVMQAERARGVRQTTGQRREGNAARKHALARGVDTVGKLPVHACIVPGTHSSPLAPTVAPLLRQG